jgi:excisionase family DNA binding protein
MSVVPAELGNDERARLATSLEVARASGNLDLSALPVVVRAQLFFTLDALASGQRVAVIAGGKPLTTTEAAAILGMSRTLLSRLCKEGSLPSFTVGTSLRIDAETVLAILGERERVKQNAVQQAATSEQRRRSGGEAALT